MYYFFASATTQVRAKHLRTSIEKLEASGNLAERAAALLALAYVEIEENPERSLGLATEALEISKKQGLIALEPMAQQGLGAAYLKLNRYKNAEAVFASALELLRSSGTKMAQINSHMGRAAIAALLGARQQMLDQIDRSLSLLEVIQDGTGSAEQLSSLSRLVTTMHVLGIHLALEAGNTLKALEYAERERAPIFLRRVAARHIREGESIPAHVVEEERQLRRRIAGMLEAIESNRVEASDRQLARDQLESELTSARRHYEKFTFEMSELYPDFPFPTAKAPLDLKKIQYEIIPEGTSLLYFYAPFQQSNSGIKVWVLDKDQFHLVSLSLTPAELWEKIRYLFNMLRGRDFDDTVAGEIYQLLIAPLQPYIRHQELIVVSHTYLHFLPFAVLWNEETGRFLAEDYALSHVPSMGALRLLRQRRNDYRGRALVMGHSRDSLPHVVAESQNVAYLLGTQAFSGPQAQESLVHTMASEADIVHIAAHARFETRNSMFSYLDLAPGDGHDGRLELHEIADLDLEGTNLVVLSACDTFLGNLQWGDDITGMTRAFLEAGSPTVMTSLWSIDDEASAVLMESFYRHLLSASSPAVALRQAQIEVMSIEKWNSPYYWAAFVLTGDAAWNPSSRSASAVVHRFR